MHFYQENIKSRRINCCNFVEYEEEDGEGGFHSSKKTVLKVNA